MGGEKKIKEKEKIGKTLKENPSPKSKMKAKGGLKVTTRKKRNPIETLEKSF